MSNINEHNQKKPKTITIHIDKIKYESPDTTTGAVLYALGNVDAQKYNLYLEVKGPGDDTLIENNDNEVDLKDGDHLYTTQKDLNPGC